METKTWLKKIFIFHFVLDILELSLCLSVASIVFDLGCHEIWIKTILFKLFILNSTFSCQHCVDVI